MLGSSKGKTALCLIMDALTNHPDCGELVESTSGNLGAAMARICASFGVGFTAVVDPYLSAKNRAIMTQHGAEIVEVSTPDTYGSFLAERLNVARQVANDRAGAVWTDQYRNPANPRAHEEITGPELLAHAGDRPLALFAPVSTGGTIRGLRDFARKGGYDWSIFAVDVVGSRALGASAGVRTVNGMGSAVESEFLRNIDDIHRVHVPELEVRATHASLYLESGVHVGASSSAAVLAAWEWAGLRVDQHRQAVCICPDAAVPIFDRVATSGLSYSIESGLF